MSQFVSSLCVPINFSTAQPKTAIQSKSKFCSAFFRGVYRVMLWTCTCNVSALLSAKSSCWSVWPIKWQSERANAGIPLVNGFKRFHQHAQIASLVSKIDALLKNILLKIHMWKTDIWKIHLFCWFRPAASPASQGAPSSSQLLLSPRYMLFLAETAAHSLFFGWNCKDGCWQQGHLCLSKNKEKWERWCQGRCLSYPPWQWQQEMGQESAHMVPHKGDIVLD